MSKKRKKILIGIITLLVLIITACYTVFIQPLLEREEIVYEEAEVFQGSFAVKVIESGSLEYDIYDIEYDVDVNVGTEEDEDEEEEEEELSQKYLEVEEVYVATGTFVKSGEALLKFSDSSVESVRRLLQSALIHAEADYNEAESEYKLAVLEAESIYELQKISGKYAGTIYLASEKQVSGDITSMELEITNRMNHISDLEEALEEAQENYDEVKEEYDAIYRSYMNEFNSTENGPSFMIAQKNYMNAKNSYERAESTLKQAKEDLEENAEQITKLQQDVALAKGKSVIERLEVEQTYSESKMGADNAKFTLDMTLESLLEDLDEAQEEKDILDEKLADFEQLVGEDGIVYATEDGLITAVSYGVGDKLEQMGNLFSYATEDSMSITVDVTQEDIVTLQVGDKVNVDFSAYEELYEGYIESINTTATSEETPTVSYQVTIHVVGSLDKLFDGMTANISFITQEKENAIYVPRKALVEQNDKTYLYVKSGFAGKTLTEVETGLRNENYVEIISGITAEDVVYIPTKR